MALFLNGKKLLNSLVIDGKEPVSGTLIEYIAKNQIANYYIKADDGSAVSYEGWSATDFMEVTEGEVLHFALGSVQEQYKYNAWYNSNKQFLRNHNFGWSAGGYRTLTVPTGAKYLRISNTTDAMNFTQIWREKEAN
jgi:hypothetical protein